MTIHEATCAIGVTTGMTALGRGVLTYDTMQKTPNGAVTIYDTSRDLVAFLHTARDVWVDKRINEVWQAGFSLDLDDANVDECQLLRYAEIWNDETSLGLYRITKRTKSRDGFSYVFDCEHVLGVLRDSKFASTLYTGSISGTDEAIWDVLDQQRSWCWQLDTCAFDEDYLYSWEPGTSALKALLDIPERFGSEYYWDFDTSVFPWKLSLKAVPSSVTAYVDYKRNLKAITKEEDASVLYTRLYPYGEGAGATQIDISSVNPTGLTYLDSNTATYGVIEKRWTDQRYTTAQQLYDAAVQKIALESVPKVTYTVDAAELVTLTEEETDRFTLGALIAVRDDDMDIDVSVRVVEINRNDVTGDPGSVTIVLSNKRDEFNLKTYVESNDLSAIDRINFAGGTPGDLPSTPTTAGLYVSTDYMGYHDGSEWKTYIDSAGRLFAQHASNYFRFNPLAGTLDIKASVTITAGSGVGNLTDAGDLATLDDIDLSKVTDAGDLAALNVVGTSQIDDLAVTSGKIDSLVVDKLTSGTMTAQHIILGSSGYIAHGKSNPNDDTQGFWLGEAAGAGLFIIGDATNYLYWDGVDLTVVGKIQGQISADLDLDNHTLYNCSSLRGASDETTTYLNLDNNEWKGVDATTYVLLNATGSIRWSAAGTVYGGTYLTLESGDEILIKSDGSSTSKGIRFETYACDEQMILLDWVYTGGGVGHDGWIKLYFPDNGATRYLHLEINP